MHKNCWPPFLTKLIYHSKRQQPFSRLIELHTTLRAKHTQPNSLAESSCQFRVNQLPKLKKNLDSLTYNVTVAFACVDEILRCDHSNERYCMSSQVSSGTVHYAGQGSSKLTTLWMKCDHSNEAIEQWRISNTFQWCFLMISMSFI